VRCFIAIDVSPEVLAGILRVQGVLRAAAARADVRWADREQLHLTLKFLGAVPDERVPDVSTALGTVTAAATMTAAELAVMASLRNLRRRARRLIRSNVPGGGDSGSIRSLSQASTSLSRSGRSGRS